jgi:transcriptional regulator with XRE-family HTH domain
MTGRQLKAARALIGMEQSELAKRAKVSIGTVRRFETFPGPIAATTTTIAAVERALEKAGIELLNADRPGVRLLMPLKRVAQ